MNNHPAKYTYKLSDVFSRVCQPIFHQSPITFLCISRVFNDGTYTSFMSDPVWTDHYVKHHCDPTISMWIEDKIKLADLGHSIWSLSDFFDINAATKNLLDDCNLFSYNNGVNIIDRHPDYYDLTTFASPLTEGVERFFIEKQGILRNYILYAKEQIFSDPQLSAEFKTHYQIPGLIEASNVKDISGNPGIELKKYYLGYPLKDDEYLTQREIDCLLPFVLGVPRKIISDHLKISARTVEAHLENIKSKCIMMDSAKFRLSFTNNRYISELIPSILHTYL